MCKKFCTIFKLLKAPPWGYPERKEAWAPAKSVSPGCCLLLPTAQSAGCLDLLGVKLLIMALPLEAFIKGMTIYCPCTKQNKGDLILDDTILHKNADKGKKCGPGKDKALMKFTDSECRVLFKCDLFRNQSFSKEDLNDILLLWCPLVSPYFRVRQHFHYKPSGICNLAAL